MPKKRKKPVIAECSIDYCAVLYAMIGARIRKRRKEAKITQSEMEADLQNEDLPELEKYSKDLYPRDKGNFQYQNWISAGTLSAIENGKATNRNVCFLNELHITKLRIDGGKEVTSACDLVWGNTDDQENLIKIWVLLTLINGKPNPFFDGSFNDWLLQTGIDEETIESQKAYIKYFTSKERYALYKKARPSSSDELRNISQFLLSGLLDDPNLSPFCRNPIADAFEMRCTPVDWTINKMLENEPLRFYTAFGQLWDKIRNSCMKVFDIELFAKQGEEVLNTVGMIQVNNQLILNLFTSFLLINPLGDIIGGWEFAQLKREWNNMIWENIINEDIHRRKTRNKEK